MVESKSLAPADSTSGTDLETNEDESRFVHFSFPRLSLSRNYHGLVVGEINRELGCNCAVTTGIRVNVLCASSFFFYVIKRLGTNEGEIMED